jgi:hypothetical protein
LSTLVERYGRWGVAGAVMLGTGAFLLIWVVRLLSSSLYGGVAVVDEVISRRTDVPAPEITRGATVTQTFVASDDDLTEVRVFLGTYMRSNTVPLVLTLSDANDRVLRTVEADPATILDNAFHSFIFEPVRRSRGATYAVTLTSPEGDRDNAFTAWLGTCDCYPDGTLSINGRPRRDQELAVRVTYHHGGVVVWRELVNRASQYKPEIVKGAGLVLLGVFSGVLALASLGVLTFSVFPRGDRREERPVWLAASVVVAVLVVVLTRAYSGIWDP